MIKFIQVSRHKAYVRKGRQPVGTMQYDRELKRWVLWRNVNECQALESSYNGSKWLIQMNEKNWRL